MCIISGNVHKVAKTNIFVAPLEDGQRQLTVYSNVVDLSEDQGVMVLPLPFPPGRPTRNHPQVGSAQVEFVDLTAYPQLFDDLKSITLDLAPNPIGKSRGGGGGGKSLAVVDVGSYKASFVPTMADFKHLDSSEFPVKPEVLQFMRSQYQEDRTAFVVCRLQKSKAYHPFGYIHFITDQRMFIPTMHYHYDADSGMEEVDWDHSIYIWNSLLADEDCCSKVFVNQKIDQVLQKLNLAKLPTKLAKFHSVAGYRITYYPHNHDLWSLLYFVSRSLE
jgi:hypothetical protein